jgi:hypothetical protein
MSMTETYPSDVTLNGLSGLSDEGQEVLYPPWNEEPYYTSFYKMLYRLLDASRRAGDLRVYKDSGGALKFGVRAGRWLNGDAAVNYAGATNQSLTDNATNYIYLTAAGALVVNTTGFPVPSVTPHMPLATIATGTASAGGVAGQYAHADITDYRGRAFLSIPGASGSGGGSKVFDWQTSVLDEINFVTSEPASPTLGDRYINTATGNSSVRGQAVVANRIYEWNGTSWTESTPSEGFCCMVEDRDMLIGYNGSAWVDIGTFALLAEAKTFFAATDISAAEAETLTAGAASDADALHKHAALDEAKTFFAATDISGAEAETLSDGSNADALHKHEGVEADTHGVGSPNVLTAAESGKTLTNEGATEENYHLLPSAAAGLTFYFYCQDSDGIRATAGSGDTIRVGETVSVAAGYVKSTIVGSYLGLKAVNATEWVAREIVGTWDLQTA